MQASALDDPRSTTFGLLVDAHARLHKTLGQSLERQHSLPLSSFEAMLRLARSPDDRLTMGDLAAQIALTSGGVTRLVDRLIDAGFAERVADPDDRRVLWVMLTAEGARRLDEAMETHLDDLQREMFARLDPGEADDLARLLGKLR